MTTREDLRRNGELTRQRLFGAAAAEEPKGFGTLLTEAVQGAIWNRPGLAMSDRMLCTLAALAVWPRLGQLRRHIGAPRINIFRNAFALDHDDLRAGFEKSLCLRDRPIRIAGAFRL